MYVRQGLFIEKIESYLKGRGRENRLESASKNDEDINVEGLCNGAALSLLEKIFYGCLNQHYQNNQPLDVLLDKAINEFFNEIESVIATDDALLNNLSYQQKLNARKNSEYLLAKEKLEAAIEESKLKIPQEIKEKNKTRFEKLNINKTEDYQIILIGLAEQQQLLSNNEANILRDLHIPDLPDFERFINHIFLLQSSDKDFTFQQKNLIAKFSQLSSEQISLPLPKLENQLCFLDNPDELFVNLTDQFPKNRLVWISFPRHTVCAFRINDNFFYYDSNNDDKKFIYCKTPQLFVFKLCLTQLQLHLTNFKKTLSEEELEKLSEETVLLCKQYYGYLDGIVEDELYINKSRNWLAQHPKVLPAQLILLENAINKLEAQDKNDFGYTQEQAIRVLPPILGFTWDVYCHPAETTHSYSSILFSKKDSQSIKEKMQLMDFKKENLLCKLIQSNDEKGLDEFLENLRLLSLQDQSAILNQKDDKGRTELMRACVLNHPNMVSKLLKAGANVNLVDKKGNTALLQTCIYNYTDIAIELLKAGANPNQINDSKLAPLQIAATQNENLTLTTILLQYNADVNYEYKGVTVFTYFCQSEDKKINNQIFSELLSYANPNELGSDNTPVLFYCITNENSKRLEMLLKRGANPNIRRFPKNPSSSVSSFINGSAIYLAAFLYENSLIVQLLLNYGAKLEKDELQDLMGKTLLPIIRMFLQFPCTAKGTTKSEQLQLLFQDYANPPLALGLFPTTWRHYKTYASEISDELKKPENKNLSDQEVRKIIEGKLSPIRNGGHNLNDGEFKTRVDLVLDHLLIDNSQLTHNEPEKIENKNSKKPKKNF